MTTSPALRRDGISVIDTEVVLVDRAPRPPVVYLVQPLMTDLGHERLHSVSDAELAEMITKVLDRVWTLHLRTDSPEVAIDAQLSNWSFTDPGEPVLLDVGTPFMRRNGKHLFDVETVLSAMPPGIRSYYRRGVAAAYMDDYFVPRLVAVDLLGNFIKERATSRLPERHQGNQRLAGHPRPGADPALRGRRVLQEGRRRPRAVPAGAPCGPGRQAPVPP